jgi:hypothetical protein
MPGDGANRTMTTKLFDLRDVRTIDLPRHARDDGAVVIAESGESVPFAIVRLFTVTAPRDAERGKHAHRLCSQFMICVHGMVNVVCDDGGNRRSFVLDRNDLALLVPPTIWSTLTYRYADSVVAVLCDRPYEKDDYVSDYAEFVAMRKASQQ